MKYVSVAKLHKLYTVRIFYDYSNKYCLQLNGTCGDGVNACSILESWKTLEEAMICARGIAKMFRLPHEHIVVEEPVRELGRC
jgi:hypothetical protein